MKKKTLIIIIVVVAVVLVLILAIFPLLSRVIWGRSPSATLFSWQLQKDTYTTDADFDAYLLEKQAENAEAYEFPDTVEMTVSVDEAEYEGMQYYVLGSGSEKLIFYFPGGSFIDAPRAVHWQFLDALCVDTGATIVIPIYPRLPDASATDVYPLLQDFYTFITESTEFDELLFMGDSAGGGMALSLAMQLRDEDMSGPEELILICPWVDLTMENPDIPAYEEKDPALDSAMLAHLGSLWAGDLDLTDPIVSPLFGSFENLGHITLITTTGELLYPDIMLLDEALNNAGISHDLIEATGVFHVWPLYIHYNIKESTQTYNDIVSAVNS